MLRKKKKNGGDDTYADMPAAVAPENRSDDMTMPDSVDEIEEKDDRDTSGPGLTEGEMETVENDSEIPDFIEENDDSDVFSEMQQAFEAWLEDAVDDENARQDARQAMSRVGEAIKEGNFDDALFDVIAKGADYDRAVREAQENGEIMGCRIRAAAGVLCQTARQVYSILPEKRIEIRPASAFDMSAYSTILYSLSKVLLCLKQQ